MKKRFLIFLTALVVLTVIFAACGESTTNTPTDTTAKTETNPVTEPTTDSATEPTTDSTTEPVTEPIEEHIFGEWIAEVPATCTANGVKGHYVCSICSKNFDADKNEIVDLVISTRGHTPGEAVEENRIDPTNCTTAGSYESVIYCTVCGNELSRENVKIAAGHTYGEWTILKEVTCTGENGERVHTCLICGISQRETIYSLGYHQYGEWVTVKEATCKEGLQKRTCSVCGAVEEEIIPADYTSHVWGDETCTICGEHKASEGLLYEMANHNEVAIWGYTGSDTTVYLPSSYAGCVVTTIRADAFKNQTQITKIVIPASITEIGSNAFSGCKNIQSATMPTSASSAIPKISLKTVIFNGGTSIKNSAFSYCSSLTSIEIPASVTSIGDSAFRGCSSLTSIEIPASVTSIGFNAFYECSSLTSVNITDIAKWCAISFDASANPLSCANNLYLNGELVTELVIPEGVTSIGDWAFYNCSSLTSIEIPASVTSIGYAAFSGCSSLTSIEIPASVTSIGDYAFSRCSSLTSITFAENSQLTSIGNSAFSRCSSLTSIELPASVTSIGAYAFQYCSSLASINYNGTKAQWNAIRKGVAWGYGKYTVYCTDGNIT